MRRPILLLLLLLALFNWKLLFSDRFTYLNSPDLTSQVLPWWDLQSEAFNNGDFPMWDPYVWGGQSLLGQMQPGAASPLNWLLFAMPRGEDGHIDKRWVHMHFALLHLLAGLLMYLFIRDQGRSSFAALLAGLGFACSGYVGAIGWPQMLAGAIWIPLTFLCFLRAMRSGWGWTGLCWAALAGGSVGMSLLSGHHQAPSFTLFALSGVFAYFAWGASRESWGKAAGLAALFGVIAVSAFFVAGLQLLPGLEYGRDAYRWVSAPLPVDFETPVPYFVHEAQRLYPITVMGLVVPLIHFQTNTFVGWVALSFALLAVALEWRRRSVRVFAVLAVVGLSYAFGHFSLLEGLAYQFVPMAEKARAGSHAVFVFQFALLTLAAFGVDRLREKTEPDELHVWLRRLVWIMLGFAAVTWFLLYDLAADGKMEAQPGDQMTLAALAALGLAALFTGWMRGALSTTAFSVALVVFSLSELYAAQTPLISELDDPDRNRYVTRYTEFRDVMDWLKRQPERLRFELVPGGNEVNIGTWHRVEQLHGHLASINRDMFDLYSESGWNTANDVMNVRYTVAKEPTREGQEEAYAAPNGWKVYRNSGAGPRTWIQHDVQWITDDAGGSADVPGVPPCAEAADELAVTTRWTIHRTLVKVRASCESYLILTDAYWPGWQADIDGRELPILRYRNALRAVRIPAGESVVQFLYRPRSVFFGAGLSAVGFILCGVAGLTLWRRRETAPPIE